MAAIYEYELVKKRLGQFRCVYPTQDRVQRLGPLLERHSDLDVALEKWLSMNEGEQAQFLNENSEAFFKLF